MSEQEHKAQFIHSKTGKIVFAQKEGELPLVTKPRIVAIIASGTDSPTTAWSRAGKTVRSFKGKPQDTQSNDQKFDHVSLFVLVPPDIEIDPAYYIGMSLEGSRLISVQSLPLADRQGQGCMVGLAIPKGATVTDIEVAIPFDKPVLTRKLDRTALDNLDPEEYQPISFKPNGNRPGLMLYINGNLGDFEKYQLVHRDGTEIPPVFIRTPTKTRRYHFYFVEIRIPDLKREDIERVDIWTYPTEAYMFKNVALRPMPLEEDFCVSI